jgi:hypothetical protein
MQDFGVLMILTVPGPPPKRQTNSSKSEIFRARAFSLLSIAGVSGFCQVASECVCEKLKTPISSLFVYDFCFSTLCR